jgi:hypothetical protein
LRSLEELCRVSNEVRIFPLLDVNANRSIYVDSVVNFLREGMRDVAEVEVPYEFQKGGNKMLRIH